MFGDRPPRISVDHMELALTIARQRNLYNSALVNAKAPHEVSYCRGAICGFSKVEFHRGTRKSLDAEVAALSPDALYHDAMSDPVLMRAMMGRKPTELGATQPFMRDFMYPPLSAVDAFSTENLYWFIEGCQHAVSAFPRFDKK